MNFHRADPTRGAFFTSGDNPEVRATQYANLLPQSAVVLLPRGISGPLRLRAATHINGSVRSTTYTNPLTDG